MSQADHIFMDMCRDILENGTDTKGEKVRPKWEDTGESAYTIKRFGVVNRYDLRKEFPALTLRRTALKSCMDEILWIYQKKSNNIHELKSHIWDAWADENGSIGTCYGDVVGRKFIYKGEETDQMDYVLRQLKENPYSRRIMTNLYQFEYLNSGALDPCCYSMTYNVTKEPGEEKLILNGVLNQRSQDILAANNWNVCQYSILLMMVAQVNDMIPGELLHVIADAHIYDRHVSAIRELISRAPYAAPKVSLNPEIKDFYDFTTNDLIVEDYQAGPQIKKYTYSSLKIVKQRRDKMNIIVAVDKNWGIGKDNRLLVSIPADMKFFRTTTTGKVVVMGRKTLESFPGGQPLKNRTNIVLTRDVNYKVKGAVIVHSVDELMEELKKYDSEDVYVIGGDSVYSALLDHCDTAHVTKIDFAYEADTWFPNLDERKDWSVAGASEEQTYFDLEYQFVQYKRNKE